MLADADLRRVEVAELDHRRGPGRHGPGGDLRELGGAHAEENLRQQLGECGFHRHLPRVAGAFGGHPVGEDRGELLVGAVLQQPGEEQVTRFKQGEVVLVLDLRGRQQPRHFQVQQRGSDDEERARLVQVPVAPARTNVGKELVGHLRQGDKRDVELLARDEAQQQVERSLEDLEVHLERGHSGRFTVRGQLHLDVRHPTDGSPAAEGVWAGRAVRPAAGSGSPRCRSAREGTEAGRRAEGAVRPGR